MAGACSFHTEAAPFGAWSMLRCFSENQSTVDLLIAHWGCPKLANSSWIAVLLIWKITEVLPDFFLQSSPWLEEHQGHGGQGWKEVKVCVWGGARGDHPRAQENHLALHFLSSTCLSVQLRNLFCLLNLPLLLLMFKTITDTMKTPAAALISATVWGLRRPDCTRANHRALGSRCSAREPSAPRCSPGTAGDQGNRLAINMAARAVGGTGRGSEASGPNRGRARQLLQAGAPQDRWGEMGDSLHSSRPGSLWAAAPPGYRAGEAERVLERWSICHTFCSPSRTVSEVGGFEATGSWSQALWVLHRSHVLYPDVGGKFLRHTGVPGFSWKVRF